METNLNYIDLITRYFNGEASAAEMQSLADWVKAEPGNRIIFDEYRQAWSGIEGNILDDQINTGLEWEKFTEQISRRSDFSRIYTLHPFFARGLRFAAILLIFLIPVFFIYQYFTPVKDQKVSASLAMTETLLPDGTRVTLNSGSSIEFPTRFEGDAREVKLQGEAYFEVQHDALKPFIVSSGNMRVKVFGTAFNVNTYKQAASMEVILTRGRISVFYKDKVNEQIMLTPGDMAIVFRNQALIRKIRNEDENYMAWKTKKLIFSNKSLGIVVQDLNRVYHSDIRLMNTALTSCRLTATFDNQTIESILNVLQSTLDISITRTGSTVEINGHGCE